MASDISSLLGNELKNTFESLLSVTATINNIAESTLDEMDSDQCVRASLSMASQSTSASMVFYLPTLISTKFEYFMLGGIGDLKTAIDDEILDATKEIVSTIGGSLATTINAQDFDDLTNVSFSQNEGSIVDKGSIEGVDHLYKIDISFNDEDFSFFISFDDALAPHMGKMIAGEEIVEDEEEDLAPIPGASQGSGAGSVLSLLGADSTENLKLLFDVKLKFSVRLGSKTFLLKDIVNWDIGHIIELEQMVNEPLDILINGTKVGEGEAVIVEGRFGVKIKHIGDKQIEV
jgi:flagellar motor switch protein FliN/FliY